MSPNRNWSAPPAGRLKADPISPWYYNDGLLNKMADGSCPATKQRSWKDRSGAVAGPISSQESPRQLIRRCNTRACTMVPVSLYTGTGQPSGHVTRSAALGGMVIRLPPTLPSSHGQTQRSACWGRSNSRSWTPALPGWRRRMCSRTNSTAK